MHMRTWLRRLQFAFDGPPGLYPYNDVMASAFYTYQSEGPRLPLLLLPPLLPCLCSRSLLVVACPFALPCHNGAWLRAQRS